MKSYDAIIIGTGAAGGIVAGVLAEAGRTCCCWNVVRL